MRMFKNKNIIMTNEQLQEYFAKILNQIFKLLPLREERIDWKKPLHTVIEELSGFYLSMKSPPLIFYSLIFKLKGLLIYDREEDFMEYRRTIFECLRLTQEVKNELIK